MLLLVGHTAQKVYELAESIRAAVEQENIPHCASPDTQWLTISVGYCVANFPASEIQFERMYAQADKALYQAKHQGRNRVVGGVFGITQNLGTSHRPKPHQSDR